MKFESNLLKEGFINESEVCKAALPAKLRNDLALTCRDAVLGYGSVVIRRYRCGSAIQLVQLAKQALCGGGSVFF